MVSGVLNVWLKIVVLVCEFTALIYKVQVNMLQNMKIY